MFLEKLKSRKFIAALIGCVTGIAVIFGVDENTIATVAGAVVSAGSLIAYIAVEGNIDTQALPGGSDDETGDEEPW